MTTGIFIHLFSFWGYYIHFWSVQLFFPHGMFLSLLPPSLYSLSLTCKIDPMKFTSSLTSRIPVADGSLSIIVPQLVAPGQLGQKGHGVHHSGSQHWHCGWHPSFDSQPTRQQVGCPEPRLIGVGASVLLGA